jgi:hypothetical protein
MIRHKAHFIIKKKAVGILLIFGNFFQFFPNLECFAKIFNITIKTPALVYFGDFFLKDQHQKKPKTYLLIGSG